VFCSYDINITSLFLTYKNRFNMKKKGEKGHYQETTKWCGTRVSLDHEKKLCAIIGDRIMKFRKKYTVRMWMEEKIDADYKKIT